jgi:hypothetical protein
MLTSVRDLFGFIARLIWKSTIDLRYIARMITFACIPGTSAVTMDGALCYTLVDIIHGSS